MIIDLKSYLFWAACLMMSNISDISAQPKPVESDRPNVLFIIVDDLRPELGCYGLGYPKTPNIDRLGSRAILFRNQYVSVPTCGASRASLLTGRLPRKPTDLTNEAFEHRLSVREVRPSTAPESFVEHFRRNGYHTLGIGKISHSPDGYIYKYNEPRSNRRELPNSWDELCSEPGIWKTGWNSFFGYANGTNRNALNGEVPPFEVADVSDEGYPDGLTAALAVEKIGQLASSTKPFFLGVGFFKPHLPFNAPKRYWDLYKPSDIPVAPFTGLPEQIHLSSLQASGEFNGYKRGEEKASLSVTLSEAYARKLRHGYMASVSYVDAQIGKLLEALRASGLEKNTIVILWGDHGWHLGDHSVWGKHTLSEWSLRSPLIMAGPGIRGGSVCDRVVRSIDIYPTLISLCRLAVPDSLDGKTLLSPSGKISRDARRQTALGFFNRGVTMRTQRYRLTKYYRKDQPDVELYDHLKDPYEHINIATRRPALTRRLLRRLPSGSSIYANR